MTFDEIWDIMKWGSEDPRKDPEGHQSPNPFAGAGGHGEKPCPRCNDTGEITATTRGKDGYPVIVVRPCPSCRLPFGSPPSSSFNKAWDDVRK
jgi:hypothetical protein